MASFRKVPLVTGEIYHIFNRGIDKRTTFSDIHEYARAFQIMKFYRFSSPPFKLSRFLKINDACRANLLNVSWGEKLVSIICYCFMPNHFHFMLRQEVDNGISKFMSQFQNSYTRYFNTKRDRIGQLFLDNFKNVLVDSEEALLHLSRYIHLNPYSSSVVNSLEDLYKYEWSSLDEYVWTSSEPVCEKEMIMALFKNKESYKTFVSDQANYQRELKRIEPLTFEENST